MQRVLMTIAVIVILGCYFYFTKPDSVVINEKGKVAGWVNKTRALVQGKKFWKSQLKMANEIYNKSIAPHPPSSAEIHKLYQKMREAENALDDKMKSLYSPEEKMAEQLRIKADSIERSAKWRSLDKTHDTLWQELSEKYKAIIPLIEAKLNTAKH